MADEKKNEEKKSKLPDLKEITEMAGKLINDVKKSVTTIYQDYKTKRKAENENNKNASSKKADSNAESKDKPSEKSK